MDAPTSSSSKFIEQMTIEEIRKVEKRMRPGTWSAVGFLTNKQSLTDLIQQDSNTLKEKNITHLQIADFLQGLMNKTETLFDQDKRDSSRTPCIGKIYAISITNWLGHQLCPFTESKEDCGKRKGSADFIIKNILTQEYFFFPSLIHHLIKKHHFFEGGPYRVDPSELIRFFNLQPGINYKVEKKEKIEWNILSSTNFYSFLLLNNLKAEHGKYQLFSSCQIQAFLIPADQKTCCDELLQVTDRENDCLFLFSNISMTPFSLEKDGISFKKCISRGIYIYEMTHTTEAVLDETDGYI